MAKLLGYSLVIGLLLVAALAQASPYYPDQPDTTSLLLAPPAGANADYLAGVSALQRRDLEAAEEAFTRAARADPNMPEPLLGLAEVALRQHKVSEAEVLLQRALALAPQRSDPQVAWAKYVLGQGRVAEAKAALERAVALDQKAVRPRLDLGDLYLLVFRNPAQAVEIYRSALALEPKNVAVLLALAKGQQQLNKLEDARATVEQAIALAPGNPLPAIAYGDVLAQAGKNADALAAYDRAIAAAPDLVSAHLAKANLLLRMGKVQEAVAEHQQVLRIDPKNVPALVANGVLEAQANRPDEAKKSFAAAFAADPHVPDVINDMAWQGADKHRDLDRALIMAREAVALVPDIAAYRDTLGWVYRARGELPQAAVELEKAAAQGDKPEILTHLGIVYAEMGNRNGAADNLRRALAIDPKYEPALAAQKQLEKQP